MKIWQIPGTKETAIYPFLTTGATSREMFNATCFIVRPDGVKMSWNGPAVMSLKDAHLLAEALIKALEMAGEGER